MCICDFHLIKSPQFFLKSSLIAKTTNMSTKKFWETMNLLIGKEYRRTGKEVMEDVEDWVEKVVVKKELSVEESEERLFLHCEEVKSNLNTSGYYSQSSDENKEVEEFIKSIDLEKIECKYVIYRRFNKHQIYSLLYVTSELLLLSSQV